MTVKTDVSASGSETARRPVRWRSDTANCQGAQSQSITAVFVYGRRSERLYGRKDETLPHYVVRR